jgi:hypothetical protein
MARCCEWQLTRLKFSTSWGDRNRPNPDTTTTDHRWNATMVTVPGNPQVGGSIVPGGAGVLGRFSLGGGVGQPRGISRCS